MRYTRKKYIRTELDFTVSDDKGRHGDGPVVSF